MANTCYEVLPGRKQRFCTDHTVMQEEWEKKNCKRNKHEGLATTRCSSISRSSKEDCKLLETETVRDDDPMTLVIEPMTELSPRYGVSSVCGRRREMEDAVAIHPSFSSRNNSEYSQHYFGVYDGHGCSHVRLRFTDFSQFIPKV